MQHWCYSSYILNRFVYRPNWRPFNCFQPFQTLKKNLPKLPSYLSLSRSVIIRTCLFLRWRLSVLLRPEARALRRLVWDPVAEERRGSDVRPSFILNFTLNITFLLWFDDVRCLFFVKFVLFDLFQQHLVSSYLFTLLDFTSTSKDANWPLKWNKSSSPWSLFWSLKVFEICGCFPGFFWRKFNQMTHNHSISHPFCSNFRYQMPFSTRHN